MEKHNRTLLILNGKGANNDSLRQAVTALRKQGWIIDVRVTWEHGDGQRYVNEAFALDASTVVAGGGDGTINEVATALVALPANKRPVLAILPLGTANDFATSAGIPTEMENALRLALIGKATPIDLAQVNNSRYFINMATGGFGTRITSETPERLKSALGGVSYFIHGLMRMDTLKADQCTIRGADFEWQGEALAIGVGNGRQAGGGQRLCPDALVNDGLLALSIVTAQEMVPTLLNAVFGNDDDNPNITRASLPWLTIHAPHEMTFNLDGEPLTGTDFRIEIIPAALYCRLPPDCSLLA
ncbi:lipid kinase YegS [Erwinia sp. OLTSP20]|uniref:lipid kinase YegS n=1 Tax=unclassified Erwinia TaxID=2622719 RepID=UPI000C184678|nr:MULTISPECIES: lipid kinase YegS [unclassified Erwinia]PIJ50557.1 lipid kinase YegS [Erwinia sp. OAMSP11]PIJ72875.1 lipid kinase YegS [Erwinia sp. OLSSP12]PIJ82205.1 lipid kinase YegS [Erwinia sp. OLCASP19]PIJ84758.1 lipid kinase YegS [Erwinia sp. OLMTSP26]PIJ86723.1 lipid kinase YegS [Erwinia sp. OLMDSP33]